MHVGRYEASESSNGVGNAVTFLLIGMGAGALVALLLAPQTGKQTRKEIRRKYEGALDTFDDWKETAKDWKDTAKDTVESALDRGAELAEELRDTARETVAPLGRALRRD